VVSAYPGSFLKKLPFGTTKVATQWSLIIILIIGLYNSHIFFTNGYKNEFILKTNNSDSLISFTIRCYFDATNKELNLSLIYGKITFACHTLFPILTTLFCNSFIIFKLTCKRERFEFKSKTKLENNKLKKHRVTISLVSTSVLYVLMTSPYDIYFAYLFLDSEVTVNYFIHLISFFSFLNNGMIFFSTWLTLPKFRKKLKKSLVNSAKYIQYKILCFK
jgi:hypothetical protein